MKKTLFLLAALAACVAAAQVSPLDYGLREAQGGMGRYFALLNAHRAALEMGEEVDYTGIDTLRIELPPDFKSIPIGPRTDFGGLVLYVTNNARHGALFTMSHSTDSVAVDGAEIDRLDFSGVSQLAGGRKLLVLRDLTPWTERRGFGYKHYRSDIVEVADGHGLNRTIAPWGTESTSVAATVVEADTAAKVFRNVTMHRTEGSTYKTYLLSLSHVSNFTVERVRITTPRSRMIADAAISVSNSVHVRLRDIRVEGTYSGYGSTRNYGYAFLLNNIYDLRCDSIVAWGNWGVFGCNNMNGSLLEDCDIDRYDVHCYGRDIAMRRCRLSGRQTPISSIYGLVSFDSCTFDNFTPVRIRASYNAYTPFDVTMSHCTFKLSVRCHSLVQVDLLDTADNPRPELAEKCLPNLDVDGLTVVVPLTVGRMNIFNPKGNLDDLRRQWGHIGRVTIDGLRLQRAGGRPVKVPVRTSTHDIKTKMEVGYEVRMAE